MIVWLSRKYWEFKTLYSYTHCKDENGQNNCFLQGHISVCIFGSSPRLIPYLLLCGHKVFLDLGWTVTDGVGVSLSTMVMKDIKSEN